MPGYDAYVQSLGIDPEAFEAEVQRRVDDLPVFDESVRRIEMVRVDTRAAGGDNAVFVNLPSEFRLAGLDGAFAVFIRASRTVNEAKNEVIGDVIATFLEEQATGEEASTEEADDLLSTIAALTDAADDDTE